MKHKNWLIFIVVMIIIIVADILLYIRSNDYFIDENVQTSEKVDESVEKNAQNDNLYRNDKYKFSIVFPEGWEQRDGASSNLLWEAFFSSSSIDLQVKEFSIDLNELGMDMNIKDLLSNDEYFNSVTNSIPNGELLNYELTKVSNEDAYYVEYLIPRESLGEDIYAKQWGMMHNNILYTISLGGPEDEYKMYNKEFSSAISSFTFED